MSSTPVEKTDPAAKPLWRILAEESALLGDPLPPACVEKLRDDPFAKTDKLDDPENDPESVALLRDLYAQIHRGNSTAEAGKPVQRRAAICFSGGGIRSATFNLGLLQRLVNLGLLGEFDYLSTVSGGGYLGSWLSAWINRHKDGRAGVQRELDRESPSAKTDVPSVTPLAPEPAPVIHLRRYSRYLSPMMGALSADAWTLLTIYLRNLTLNWLLLVPWLLAALMLPRLCASVVALDPVNSPITRDWPTWVLQMGLPGAALFASAWAFAYAGIFQPSGRTERDKDTRVPLRKAPGGQTHFLRWCLTPLLIGAVLLGLYWAWVGHITGANFSTLAVFGVLLAVVGWTAYAFVANDLEKLRELPAIVLGGLGTGGGLWTSAFILSAIERRMPLSAVPSGEFIATQVCVGLPLVLMSLSFGGTLYVGFSSRLQTTWDIDREWWARFGAWVMIASVVWLGMAALVLFGPAMLLDAHVAIKWIFTTGGGLAGIVSLALGHGSDTTATPAQPTPQKDKLTAKLTAVALAIATPVFIGFLIVVASTLSSLFLGKLCLSIKLWNAQSHYRIVIESSPICIFLWIVGLLVGGLIVSWRVNLNKFSLHGVYRDRLTRAYLGASRTDTRHPDPFTGFDVRDNPFMYTLHAAMLKEEDLPGKCLLADLAAAVKDKKQTDTAAGFVVSKLLHTSSSTITGKPEDLTARQLWLLLEDLNFILLNFDLKNVPGFAGLKIDTADSADVVGDSPRLQNDRQTRNRLLLQAAFPGSIKPLTNARLDSVRPLHLVNIALNLVNGNNPAWQERKAESFTVSCLHSGNWRLGYRDSHTYGGDHGISLGTAMTISGAAVSPNMGYQSSKPLAFLMTLFNIRLGWWLGNPGKHGASTYHLPCPKSGFTPLIGEAFGLTDEFHKYVYLSDGGHFENLGIYEMVRRRCHWIVVGDAGADPECGFEDLGNAVRKIRIDTGVSIAFKNGIKVGPRDGPDPASKRYCAIGEIDYKTIDGQGAENGWLLYIKPAFYGIDEPADVYSYAKARIAFPHQPTADQFFSESQFESYRALGYHITESLSDHDPKPDSLNDLFASAWDYLGLKETENPFRSQMKVEDINDCPRTLDSGTTRRNLAVEPE